MNRKRDREAHTSYAYYGNKREICIIYVCPVSSPLL
jgi:hypothetical protein